MADDLCLVTGASGFIGGRLTARLVGEGFQVRCLVRPSSDTRALERLGVDLAVGDLTAGAGPLARTLQGCTHVLHCGAMVTDWAAPAEVVAVNVAGTRNLLDACASAAGVERFVHLSSTDVYGYPGGFEVDEAQVPRGFRNWYAQTKLAAEAEVRRAAARGLPAVILRPATVYGPGSREVVLEIARALRRRRMLLIGGGRATAGLCYVDNLVDAALPAMREAAAVGEAFNVSDGVGVTWRRFADDLADGLGVGRPRLSLPFRLAEGLGFSLEHGYRVLHRTTGLTTRPLLSRQAVHVMGIDQSFSTARARALLGWEPRVGYAAGLAATVEWLRSEGV